MVPLVVAAAVSLPTKGQCAGAWNRDARMVQLARARREWEATVSTTMVESYTFTWTKNSPPRTTGTVGPRPACVVFLKAGAGTAVEVSGIWSHGAVAWGKQHEVPAVAGDGNACVAVDGTIRRIGRFTAATRCPRP